MKRILTLITVLTALVWTTPSVMANFVLVFDDPDTPQEEFRIEDEGLNDSGPGVGNLQFNGTFEDEEFVVGVTALSKDFEGTRLPLGAGFPENAEFSININLFTSKSGRSMTVRLTDTGYNSSYDQADCYINTALGTVFNVDGAESIQFTFYGDSGDTEFGQSFVIGSSDVIASPDDQNLIVVSGAAQPVGSLTIETTFIGNGMAEARFTQVIAVAPGSPAEPQPPTITMQPESVSAEEGDTVEFSTAASGTSPFNYSWLYNGATLPGETNSTLTLTNVVLSQSGDYQASVINGTGSDLSSIAVLTVFGSGGGSPPTFTLQPVSEVVNVGDTVTFTTASSGSSPRTYQWQFNGIVLPGETAATLILENVQPNQTGVYKALVSNDFGSEVSEPAALIVMEPGEPVIVEEPNSQIVDVGDAAEFSVTVTGEAPFTFQWYRDGAQVPGATSTMLALTDVQLADAGGYQVFVNNAFGLAVSSVAMLTVNPSGAEPPTITGEPESQTVNVGNTAVFSVTATGTAPLSYQWYRDAVDLPGETSSDLTLNNVQQADVAAYSVLVRNSSGTDLSAAATLTVVTEPTFIVEGDTVMQIQNLPVSDQWEIVRIYDVTFVYDDAFSVYGSELDYELVDENAGLGLNAVMDALNTFNPTPEFAGPNNDDLFHIGAFTEEIFVTAVGAAYHLGAWDVADEGFVAGVTTVLPDEVVTWASFTEVTAEPPEPDAPTLSITNSAPGEMTISWSPDTPGFMLQVSTNLLTNVWVNASSGPTNPAVSTPIEQSQLYRLLQP